MLYIEKLVCKNNKFHKGDCTWTSTAKPYNDASFGYLTYKGQQLARVDGTAYRIIHHKLGVLYTIKLGHDKRIFIAKDSRAISKMFKVLKAVRFARAR